MLAFTHVDRLPYHSILPSMGSPLIGKIYGLFPRSKSVSHVMYTKTVARHVSSDGDCNSFTCGEVLQTATGKYLASYNLSSSAPQR